MRQAWAWARGCALLLGLLGCQRDSAEQRLRKDIAAMQAAVEEHRLRDAMAAVAEDVAGEARMDRAALHNPLRAQFLANARIGVSTGPLSIQLQGDDATVRFDALVSGGDGRLLPERISATPWSPDGASATASGGCGMRNGVRHRSVATRASAPNGRRLVRKTGRRSIAVSRKKTGSSSQAADARAACDQSCASA